MNLKVNLLTKKGQMHNVQWKQLNNELSGALSCSVNAPVAAAWALLKPEVMWSPP